MIEIIVPIVACWVAFAFGYATAVHRTKARNAAHSECLDCTHRTPNAALRDAQSAARAHKAETGHLALVVAN